MPQGELLTKMLLVVSLIYIFARVFPVIIKTFLSYRSENKKKSSREIDLDILIEREKYRMTHGMGVNSEVLNNKKKTDRDITFVYTERLKKFKSDSPEYLDAKNVLTLLDELKWGTGTQMQSLAQQWRNKWSIDIDVFKISKTFSFLAKKTFFLYGTKKEKPLYYQDILKIVESFILLMELAADIEIESEQANGLIKKLTFSRGITQLALGLALQYILLNPKLHREQHFFEAPLLRKKISIHLLPKMNEHDFENAILELIFNHETGVILGFQDILELIKNYSDKYYNLIPVTPLPANQSEYNNWAINVLGIKEQNLQTEKDKLSKAQILNRFKELARHKHPDKIPIEFKSPKLEKLANQNFLLISQAKDILLSQISAKS
jgi:hypothetical protein